MPSSVGTSGGNKTIAAITVGTSGGNKGVLVGYVGTSGGNKVWFSALSASASPSSFSQTTVTAPDTNINGPATASVSGGIGPFTYAWSRTGGSATVTATAPTSAATSFSAFQGSAGVITSTWICTVTDTATGFSAITNTVSTSMRAL